MNLSLREFHNQIVARELCAAAGVPLRDRYGYAASEEEVARLLGLVLGAEGNVSQAVISVMLGTELASAVEMPLDERYAAGIVAALGPFGPLTGVRR